jgi:hypothetical protein
LPGKVLCVEDGLVSRETPQVEPLVGIIEISTE